MTSDTPDSTADAAGPGLHLARWSVTSGSNVQSRGVVVVAGGGHQWEGTAEGNGPVAALFGAVDRALHEVLTGRPRLLAYDVHAVAEGPDAEGEVTVSVAPPEAAGGVRSAGRYTGRARSANIIAASVEAYVDAVNRILSEAHWADATAAARGRSGRAAGASVERERAEFDASVGDIDTTDWFNRPPHR